MVRVATLVRENMDHQVASITLEQGKTFADAKGDVLRGIQVCETACGITTQLTGEVLQVTKDMELARNANPLVLLLQSVRLTSLPWSRYGVFLSRSLLRMFDPETFGKRPW
jgi:hypothetical protein